MSSSKNTGDPILNVATDAFLAAFDAKLGRINRELADSVNQAVERLALRMLMR